MGSETLPSTCYIHIIYLFTLRVTGVGSWPIEIFLVQTIASHLLNRFYKGYVKVRIENFSSICPCERCDLDNYKKIRLHFGRNRPFIPFVKGRSNRYKVILATSKKKWLR